MDARVVGARHAERDFDGRDGRRSDHSRPGRRREDSRRARAMVRGVSRGPASRPFSAEGALQPSHTGERARDRARTLQEHAPKMSAGKNAIRSVLLSWPGIATARALAPGTVTIVMLHRFVAGAERDD